MEANLDNIMPYIEAHPETEFHIFFPPYSMFYWEQEILRGRLDSILKVYEATIRRLCTCDNVRLYYFQDEFEMISNPDNYRDSGHHIPEYNRYIFECIRDDRDRIDETNLEERLEGLREYAEAFDYSALWIE